MRCPLGRNYVYICILSVFGGHFCLSTSGHCRWNETKHTNRSIRLIQRFGHVQAGQWFRSAQKYRKYTSFVNKNVFRCTLWRVSAPKKRNTGYRFIVAFVEVSQTVPLPVIVVIDQYGDRQYMLQCHFKIWWFRLARTTPIPPMEQSRIRLFLAPVLALSYCFAPDEIGRLNIFVWKVASKHKKSVADGIRIKEMLVWWCSRLPSRESEKIILGLVMVAIIDV